MRAISVTAMVIILKMQFWKLLDISGNQSSLAVAFERHLRVADFMGVDQHTRKFFLG